MKLRESFSLPYNGGEIWFSNLDSLYDNEDIFRERFINDMKVVAKPSTTSFVAVNLYDTNISSETADFIVENLISVQKHITKIALVNMSSDGKRNIKNCIKKSGMKFDFLLSYFNDLEKAKEWLINKK